MFKQSFKYLLLIILLAIPSSVLAYSDYIIAGGENIGIEVKMDGVLVTGSYKNIGNSFKVGDLITTLNGNRIYSSNEMNSILNDNCMDSTVIYKRDDIEYETTLKVENLSGICKTGLYVKDSVLGIGTLTYIDPNTKIYGALGHEIIDQTTNKILSMSDGSIFNASVTGIIRSEIGSPGEKKSRYDINDVKGIISKNTNKGIFGLYSDTFKKDKLYKVANNSEINKGAASILTVLDGQNIENYTININKINRNSDTKNIEFEINDNKLIEAAGGIVQGMSGSPIIQDNKIIGAVTHVAVENPIKGYGIFITNMLEEAEKKD